MIDLRELVAQAIWEGSGHPPDMFRPLSEVDPRTQESARNAADAAIRATIEALVAEAESHITGQQPIGGQRRFQWARTAQFLRSHLPTGRDGEAGDAQ